MVSCDKGETRVVGRPQEIVAEAICILRVIRRNLIDAVGQDVADDYLHHSLAAVFMSMDDIEREDDEKRKKAEEIERVLSSPQIKSGIEAAVKGIVEALGKEEAKNE